MYPIRMTQTIMKKMYSQMINDYKGMFALRNIDLKISTKLANTTRIVTPTVIIEELAYRKMLALTTKCDKEIAWHGVVDYDVKTQTFTVVDIVVFPQKITASTVVSDDDSYGPWIMSLEDATFNRMRLHGHSHVNMGVTPSTVDLQYQETMLHDVKDYYIFMIMNKKEDLNIWVYDVARNIMFDKDDVTVILDIPNANVWADTEIKDKVMEYKYTASAGTLAANQRQGYSSMNDRAKDKDKGKDKDKTKANPATEAGSYWSTRQKGESYEEWWDRRYGRVPGYNVGYGGYNYPED